MDARISFTLMGNLTHRKDSRAFTQSVRLEVFSSIFVNMDYFGIGSSSFILLLLLDNKLMV